MRRRAPAPGAPRGARDPRARRPAGVETARARRARCTGATGARPAGGNRPDTGARAPDTGAAPRPLETDMRRLVSLLAVPVLAVHAAAAQDVTTLPERVVTATRIPTLIERIPAGVTVIDRT